MDNLSKLYYNFTLSAHSVLIFSLLTNLYLLCYVQKTNIMVVLLIFIPILFLFGDNEYIDNNQIKYRSFEIRKEVYNYILSKAEIMANAVYNHFVGTPLSDTYEYAPVLKHD